MSDFPVIRTPRLILRELCPADVPALFAIHSDADAMQWFGTDPITDYPQAEQLLAQFSSWRTLPNPGVRWCIERQSEPGLLAPAACSNGTGSGAAAPWVSSWGVRRKGRG
ncbi:hypothetical protein PBOI14_30450 [Pseudomonas sp. Boi14]|nr:hypothetical protein PBOI14_30450 [Pseudomonas sp. Boi14]